MAEGLSELIYHLASDAAFRTTVAGSIVQTASDHGISLDAEDHATIADGLGRLMAPPREVGGNGTAPWPGGPSFSSTALD